MLSHEYLHEKVKRELGSDFQKIKEYQPLFSNEPVRERKCPLGVVLHIAAGNAEGLPIFSVIEGLLTGNINILKLPEMDDGISSKLLMELIQIQPALTEYIYIFDYSSKEVDLIKKIADLSDAIVVWGSSIAINAVRHLAKENTKIIEWGHKISFAYVTQLGMTDEQMIGLAQNICDTDQMLCNSCQGIFIDTDNMEILYDFCERFLIILDTISKNYSRNYHKATKAQITLQLRNEEIDALYHEKKIYRKNSCSLIAYTDSTLDTSILFRNCWVKRLPSKEIIMGLKDYKNHLQTVGLLCDINEIEVLSDIFSKTGITRVTKSENMSINYCGTPHDGEYALQRYIKIVSFE